MLARKRSSLKLSLVMPFVVLIALLTGALGVLWYWTGTRMVSTLSRQLMIEMVERIGEAIDRNIYHSRAMLEVAFPQGLPAPSDITEVLPALRARLWAATWLDEQPGDYVYYANIAGQGIGLRREGPDQAELRIKTLASAHRQLLGLNGIRATPVPRGTEENLFEPRTRPWFLQAKASSRNHIWTPTYIDFNAHDLVVTRARRLLSAEGRFEGVVGADISLRSLQKFLSGLPLEPGARAFILEANGQLIAASDMPNLREMPNAPPQRINAAHRIDPMLLSVYEHLRPIFKVAGPVMDTALYTDADGTSIQYDYRRVTDGSGLDWLAIVAVPHDDMIAGIRGDVILVVALGLLALGIALGLGLWVFGGVARDMRTLTHAVRRVGQGEINTPIALRRKDEIGELAVNFQKMRHRLFTDPLTGCINRNALQHSLAAMTRPVPEGQPQRCFALLFLDLNRFKPLNDRWGHDNGDRALAEVAQRIKAQLRDDDLLARLGGDEFVAILEGVSQDRQLEAIRQKIEAELQLPLRTLQGIPEDVAVTLGVAMGAALYPRDGRDPPSLLKRADQDMYRNKKAAGEAR